MIEDTIIEQASQETIEELNTTPMMLQWNTCKLASHGALLFFRMGDFYEAFHDDAKTIANALELTLTKRQEIPMCGVPHHTSEAYIDKLVALGYRVAIAEQTEDPKKDISIYINSPGGSVTAGLAIYDTMQFMSFDINTYCIGQAASMAAVLLSAGTKGKRYVLPNSAVMIHQPYGGVTGSAEDISRQIEQILKSKDVMSSIMSKHTGQELSKIIADCDRDYFMSAKEAIAYGAADKEVLPRQHEVAPK